MTAEWLITPHAEAVSDWIAANLEQSACEIGRDMGSKGRLVMLTLASAADRQALDGFIQSLTSASPAPMPTFGGTQPRLSLYSRNTVSWLSTRSWCNATKKADIRALKGAKKALDPVLIDHAAGEMARTLGKQIGQGSSSVCVTHVACGHSQRPDCFACQLAQAVAKKLGFTFRKLFRDRFVKGVSHPKEFIKLPPLELDQEPQEALTLVIDDVATSGWHMAEALETLRGAGHLATGATWLSGNVD